MTKQRRSGRTFTLIPAAGRGARFRSDRSKLLSPLRGREAIHWTLTAIEAAAEVDGILLGVAAGERDAFARVVTDGGFTRVQELVDGGDTRGETVGRLLEAVPPDVEVVLVHDGARPLVSPALIAAVIQAAREHGSAAPATPVTDTIRWADAGEVSAGVVDRERLRAVQTPQGFRREVLTRAVKRAAEGGLETTDDAALVEALGQPVHLVPGERTNLKLTVPEDVPLIEALLPGEGSRAPAFRVGFGYDIHRFSAERPLVLGGVRLRESDGLEGHSDADVVLHAVCDALLGAAALGDIGQHFSDTDPRWKGADSRVLLGHVAELVHQAGWSVGNLDVTVLCERPKIMPHAAAMREAIALSAGCATSQVNLKATTLEGLGALGQCEGIAAQAVGMLVRSHR